MNHASIRKYLALVCILVSALLLVCACTPEGGNGNGTTADNGTTDKPTDETVSGFGTESTVPEETTAAPTDEPTAYKITVLDPNGNPFKNAFISCNEDMSIFGRTDENGVATVTAKASYTLKIVAGNYGEITLPLTSEVTELTVNLKPVDDGKVDYKVTVVDENGAPLAGVKVQLCIDTLCQSPVNTDENGIAIVNAIEDNYTAKITKDGYTGEAEYTFPEGSREMTVTLTKN